jgi:hypothetical protein
MALPPIAVPKKVGKADLRLVDLTTIDHELDRSR